MKPTDIPGLVLTSEIYEIVNGKQVKTGEIVLKDGKLSATDGIGEEILNSFSDDGKRLLTKHDPAEFMASLPIRYRSPYLRVSAPSNKSIATDTKQKSGQNITTGKTD